jgi:putative peptidoglycan lipid II flippase
LLASTTTRIYQSAFFALRDTRTPARTAVLRVLTAAFVGAIVMTQFEAVSLGAFTIPAGIFGGVSIDGLSLGPVGLALGASVGAWLEWLLLRAKLVRRMGKINTGLGYYARTFGAAFAAAAVGFGASLLIESFHPLMKAAIVGSTFGVVYFATAFALGLGEARVFVHSVLRRVRR